MANLKPGQPHAEPAWRWMGERGLRLDTGGETLRRYEALAAGGFEEIEDIIPADGSILLIFCRGAEASPALWAALTAPLGAARPATDAPHHRIRVVFGGAAGPDLAECAARAGRQAADYVQELMATEFTVAFLGFQPGFPYLTGLPPVLAAPRRATPRTRVAAGSVAIGGAYAGIYPAAGPGGWNLVGQTPARLFDPAQTPPALFRPGDRVRLVAA